MVERPIKKSERQTNTSPSHAVEEVFATESNSVEGSLDANPQTLKEQITAQPVRRKDKTDKTKEKGKGNQQKNEALAVNPALVRGPKPKKTELPITKESQEVTPEDTTSELNQETAADG